VIFTFFVPTISKGNSMSKLSFIGAAILVATFGHCDVQAASTPHPTTVVLVHGAFADGSSWRKVIPLLEARGLRVVAVQNPLSSLAGDVDATKRVIDAQPGSVILVGHSWAGMVISQAGNDDKVKALVYVAAFALPKGVSINDLGKGQPPAPWLTQLQPDSAGYLRLSDEAVA
jgi:pimeloyl-ACP methyl ester carboxylesterase